MALSDPVPLKLLVVHFYSAVEGITTTVYKCASDNKSACAVPPS
jgi:hypothetical protein